MSLLTFTDLTHHLIKCSQAKPLSASYGKGQLVLLTGYNGSGKTTLLKLLAGLLPAESGSINAAADLSYCGATLGLKTSATLAHYLTYMNMTRRTKEIPTHCSSFFTVTDTAPKSKRLNSFSSGQQQSIRLKGLLLQDRPIWLLDEPTQFLDQAAEAHLWESIALQQKRGGLIIMATHEKTCPLPTYVSFNLNPPCSSEKLADPD